MNVKEQAGLVPRKGWAPGPWDDEPDRVDWIDDATGYPCQVIRHYSMGHLCGYVAVPPGHPLHGVNHEDDQAGNLSAHLGVNYSEPCMEYGATETDGRPEELMVCHVPEPGEPDDVWWFGFDCGHAWDIQPGMDARYRELVGATEVDHHHLLFGDRRQYRPLAYVRNECTDLAAQLAEATA